MPSSVAPIPLSAVRDALHHHADEALKRASEHLRNGELEDAVNAYDEALAILPNRLSALVNKGVALRGLKRFEEALACYWRALAAHPDNSALWCNAGNALLDLERLPEAEAKLRVALARMPRAAEVWLALGTLLTKRKHSAAAIVCVRRAVGLKPKNVAAQALLASLLADHGAPQAAIAAFRAAMELAPASSNLHSGLGQLLVTLGRLDEAEPHFRKAIALGSKNLDAHLGLARLLFLRGDLAAAWPEYEWRRRKSSGKFPKLSGPEWDGSDPNGKSILVYAEQGLGDLLQFIRYVPLLAAWGARVIVGCPPSMIRLFQAVEGVASVHAEWRRLPAHDFHIPLLSLPWLMGTTSKTIPAEVPYLSAPADGLTLRAPLGTKLKVGIVWAGSATHSNDADRSVPLETILPIAGIPGIAFYSLQVGPRVADLTKFAHPALIGDLSPKLRDFAATAEIVEQLDLVITVDTSVAHLAGALAKPVWVLIAAAPEWRWQRDREDSPWYPTMRLFRQTERGDWATVADRVVAELKALLTTRPPPPEDREPIGVDAIFARPDGTPRFRMTTPRALLADPGVRFLVKRECDGTGYEYATRCFLDAHLEPGDLFIDVGAHWGIMSLQAATRWPGQVAALALEPLPVNLPHLQRWLTDNGVAGDVEVIAAAASDIPGNGSLLPESTMGHRLQRSEAGAIPVVTIDGLLAERPDLQRRRTIVKIDVEGTEPDVVAGMEALLASGKVAAVIWERGLEYESVEGQKRLKRLRKLFAKLGFTAWRFSAEDVAGALEPFVEKGLNGNIIELAPGIQPRQSYGVPRPAPAARPVDPALDATLKAQQLLNMSLQLHEPKKIKELLNVYAVAAALDGTSSALYNNLGVTLRGLNRNVAAVAAYRRAMELSPDNPGLMSNLGNVLRELGHLAEAETLQARAVELSPDDAGLLFNLGTVKRDQGEPKAAVALFERALARAPGNGGYQWDRALGLLQQGDYANGFPAYEARWSLARPARKKIALPLWDGSPLEGRNIFLHDEQGYGDVLQFSRFIPELKRRGAGKVVLECQPELMRLMASAPGVDAVIPRGPGYAVCDVYAPLLSLPGILGTSLESLPAECPYLVAPEPVRRLDDDGRLKVGLVWAGKEIPRDRSVPVQKLFPVLSHPLLAPYSLQLGPQAADLKAQGGDAFIGDLGPFLSDFAETAAMVSQLDLLISIDTSVVHLAGALGVPTFVLLRYTSDWRWFDRGAHSPWYPSLTLFRQEAANQWDAPMAELERAVTSLAERQGR